MQITSAEKDELLIQYSEVRLKYFAHKNDKC